MSTATTSLTPDAEKVMQLQAVHGYPAVSLLLTTTPGPVMAPADEATLRRLHAEAVRRLENDDQAGDTADLLDRLESLVTTAVDSRTGHAMAVYAHRSTGSIFRLPVTVPDRVVVDPTFATRDLVRAMHRTPFHLVLSLSRLEARLFAGTDTLHPVRSSPFPVLAPRPPRRSASRPAPAAGDTTVFLRAVDAAFGTYRRAHPAPFVITGDDRVVSEFERLSRNLDRCAGTWKVNPASEPLTLIAARTRPLLEAYLLSRQEEALTLLGERLRTERAVVGLPAVWLAARHDRPEMLAVEQGLFQAARVSPDGATLDLVHDPAVVAEDPDVVDDVIDDVMELVLHRGGWVALVDDGRLERNGGIALTPQAWVSQDDHRGRQVLRSSRRRAPRGSGPAVGFVGWPTTVTRTCSVLRQPDGAGAAQLCGCRGPAGQASIDQRWLRRGPGGWRAVPAWPRTSRCRPRPTRRGSHAGR